MAWNEACHRVHFFNSLILVWKCECIFYWKQPRLNGTICHTQISGPLSNDVCRCRIIISPLLLHEYAVRPTGDIKTCERTFHNIKLKNFITIIIMRFDIAFRATQNDSNASRNGINVVVKKWRKLRNARERVHDYVLMTNGNWMRNNTEWNEWALQRCVECGACTMSWNFHRANRK